MMHRHALPLAFAIAVLVSVPACSKVEDVAASEEDPGYNGSAIPSINEPARPAKDAPPPGAKPLPATKRFYSAPVENSPAKEF